MASRMIRGIGKDHAIGGWLLDHYSVVDEAEKRCVWNAIVLEVDGLQSTGPVSWRSQ